MSTPKGSARQSNIELLRLLASFMVMAHHFNMIAGLTQSAGFNRGMMFVVDALAVSAVDIFIMITGYFAVKTTGLSLWKPIKLLLQVSVVRGGFYLASLLTGAAVFSVKGLVSAVLPSCYYVVFYCVLITLAPFINFLLRRLSRRQLDTLLLICLLLFSVYATFIDAANSLLVKHGISPVYGISTILMDGSGEGYTIVNFVMLYMLGAWLSMNEDRVSRLSTRSLLLCELSVLAVICVWTWATNRQGFVPGVSLSYCSPFVIAEAALLFLLFKRVPMRGNRLINSLAGASLMSYICHTQIVLRMGEADVGAMSVPVFFGYTALWLVGMYLLSYAVYRIYTPLERLVFGALQRRFGELRLDVE